MARVLIKTLVNNVYDTGSRNTITTSLEDDDDFYTLELRESGALQGTLTTDRASIERLRDNLTRLLDAADGA